MKNKSKQVKVGGKILYLHNSALVADDQNFLTLDDLIAVFHERDVEQGKGQELRFDKIIYDIRDYQR